MLGARKKSKTKLIFGFLAGSLFEDMTETGKKLDNQKLRKNTIPENYA